ncbi:transcriptional regulator [Opitutaceae bacterium TAV1]|nr:transcriptional regulator [Opitutaceae bacterium TAV1]
MKTKQRVSIRDVARAAGVSAMTVSYALRDKAGIPPETRQRVREVAEKLGYVRDPQMAYALTFARRKDKPVYRETIVLLASILPAQQWLRELAEGAKARTAELGYGFEVRNYDVTAKGQRAQSRQLHARGVRGLIVTPDLRGTTTTFEFEWDKFAAIEFDQFMSPSILTRVTRDIPDDYIMMFEQLRKRGYRRIGLAVTRETDRIHHHAPLSAYLTWHHLNRETTTLLPELESREKSDLLRWLKRHKPDAVVINGPFMCEQIRAVGCNPPEDIGVCRMDATGNDEWSGLRPDHADMGRAAVDLLVSALERGKIGLPEKPRILNIPNHWHEGTTLRTLPAATGEPMSAPSVA